MAPPTTAVPATTATASRPSTTAPANTAAATTRPPAPTTAAPTTAPTTARPAGPAVADPEGFVRTYYATLAQRDYAAAWAMLAPEFQQAQPGSYPKYVEFWQGVDGIVVRSVDVRGAGDRPTCRLGMRYTIGDRTTDETDEVTLRTGPDGQPLISTYRVVGPG
jgi:ketosteroid isomerase-like protein